MKIPTNNEELNFWATRMTNVRYKHLNDVVENKEYEKYEKTSRDAACAFFGFDNGYEELKAYWENNPLKSLGEQAYVMIDPDGNVRYYNKHELSTSSSGKSGFKSHEIKINENHKEIKFSEEKLKEIAENYYFDCVYFQHKEKNNIFIMDTYSSNILQNIFIFEKLKNMPKYEPNSNPYENDFTSKSPYRYEDKIPNITFEYDGKLNARYMLIQLVKKGGYLMTVLTPDDKFEYEVAFNSTSDLYHHIEKMHMGNSKIVINKI